MDRAYVTRKGTEQPVGYILSANNGTTTVRWGISDGRNYDEHIPTDELIPFEEKIVSHEEIQIRQAKEAGTRFKIEGEK